MLVHGVVEECRRLVPRQQLPCIANMVHTRLQFIKCFTNEGQIMNIPMQTVYSVM